MPQLTPSQLNYAETSQWKAILRAALNDLRVSIPAIVQDFDPLTQSCTVKVAIREVVRTPDGPQNTEIAPILKVPVILPSAGGFSLTLPLVKGDEGLLVFCDMCFDLWWTRSGVQNQLERRRHDLTDCGFFPGAKSNPNVIPNYSTISAQLRSNDGTVIVDVAPTGITLTAPLVQINSTGDVDITAAGAINLNAGGALTADAGGLIELGAGGEVDISGTDINVDASAAIELTAVADIDITGVGVGIVASTAASIDSPAVDIGTLTVIDGKPFLLHEHTGVTTGGGVSGPPL